MIGRSWYGNVRELRNAIEHAGVLARSGVISPEHLPVAQPLLEPTESNDENRTATLAELTSQRTRELLDDPSNEGTVYERYIQEVERPLLEGTLARFGNEYAPAARVLGLHRTTLKRKMDQMAGNERSKQV